MVGNRNTEKRERMRKKERKKRKEEERERERKRDNKEEMLNPDRNSSGCGKASLGL